MKQQEHSFNADESENWFILEIFWYYLKNYLKNSPVILILVILPQPREILVMCTWRHNLNTIFATLFITERKL